MNHTIADKVCRLGAALASKPTDIPRWLRTSRPAPLRSGLPWLAWGAIDVLETFLTSHHSVFEYGTGGSTLFFARRTARVTSVEDDPRWYDTMHTQLLREQIRNVTVHLAESVSSPYAGTDYVRALDEPHDVILIDGHEHRLGVDRMTCFRRAEQYVTPGGLIILDGAWRFNLDRHHTRARQASSHEGIGPGRKWLTRTDLYFY